MFDWMSAPAQPMGGMFGSGPQQPVNNMGVLAALLQDLGANYDGRQATGLSGLQQRMGRLGDQQKYQEALKSAFGAETVAPVLNTPSVFEASPAQRQMAMQAQQNSPTMMFSGPTGQALGYEQAAAMLPMLQNMDPGVGMPALFQAMGQAQQQRQRQGERMEDRGYQVQDRTDARAQTLQDNAVRPATPEEKARFGYAPQTPVFMDGFGKPIVTQDPNAITPLQQRQIDLDNLQFGETRRHNTAMEANANKGPAPPSGYRYGANNSLEFIPGGPADPAVAGRGTGKPTEDQAKNAQLYTLSKQILPQVLAGFDELGGVGNAAGRKLSGIPLIGPNEAMVTSPKYQQAKTGLNSLVANFLYSTSGATANPGEIENRAATVTPQVGDSAETKALKRQAILDMVESIKLRASPQLLNQPRPEPQQAPSPPRVQTGAEYDRLPTGSVYIAPDGSQRTKR